MPSAGHSGRGQPPASDCARPRHLLRSKLLLNLLVESGPFGLDLSKPARELNEMGRIDVETQPGTFTEFIVTLPRGNGITVD